MDGISKTTAGITKAIMKIGARNQELRSKPKKNPRYAYHHAGYTFHMKRGVTVAERARIELLAAEINNCETAEQRKPWLEALGKMPVHAVPFKRATLLDHSRYTGSMLRKIRAEGGGAKERARAARRAGAAA